MNLDSFSIQSALDALQRKTIKPREIIEAALANIEARNSTLNALLAQQAESALARASELEKRASEAARLPLYGIPVAIKDNFLLRGWKTTAGSKILSNYVAPYTATSVERLEAAGAVVVGKTNLDEFAMGSSTENSAFGPVRNPWNTAHVPGGSSGGSAAAVSGGLALGALGTDTGGSIRQPASLCGIVGLKPTYGRVSRYGVIAFASSLDQVGPFGKTVWDVARQLEVISGYDSRDATSSRAVVPRFTESLGHASLKGASIGVARSWLEGVDPDVAAAFERALDALKSEGAKLVDIELPHARYALSTYYLIAPSEASSNLARYDGIHYGFRSDGATGDQLYSKSRGAGFGPEVKMRVMLGTYALSAGYYDAFYLKANRVRRSIQQDFEKAFTKCAAIVSPTAPTTAFQLGSKTNDPLTMYLSDVFTLPINLAGLPGVSIPAALDGKGLPIGLQFIGKPFDESTILGFGAAFERVRGTFPSPTLKRASEGA